MNIGLTGGVDVYDIPKRLKYQKGDLPYANNYIKRRGKTKRNMIKVRIASLLKEMEIEFVSAKECIVKFGKQNELDIC